MTDWNTISRSYSAKYPPPPKEPIMRPVNPVSRPKTVVNVIADNSAMRSTQEMGTVRRSNPVEPSPWQQNESVSRITDLFAEAIPTIAEVAQATMMMSSANPFAVRTGNFPGQGFGAILMNVRAMNQQRQNEIASLMQDQQKHEFLKEKFMYDQHKDAIDIIREQAQQNTEGVGEVYRELMDILPKLESTKATELMNNIMADPIAVESLQDPQQAYQFIMKNMQRTGLKWKETRRVGGVKATSVSPEKKLKSSTVRNVNVDGVPTMVQVRTMSDGSTELVNPLTNEPLPKTAQITTGAQKKKEEGGNLAALQAAFGLGLSNYLLR